MMASLSLRRLYAPEFLVKDELKKGVIPGAKEVYRDTLSVAWASIAESFLIAMISMADTIMVSGMGETAIAAVGLAMQPRFIVQTLVLSMNVAVTSITARRKGEQNQHGALVCLKQGLVLCGILSVLLSIIGLYFSRQLLMLTGGSGNMLEMSQEYFIILLLGLPFCNLSLTISSAQRGIGHTKASMKINMIANCINILLNYPLIYGFWFIPAMGIRGAAIATVIGWISGLLLAISSVSHRGSFLHIFSRGEWAPTKEMIRTICKVASGAFLEQLCMRVGFLLYTNIVARLGEMVYAANVIMTNLMSLSFSFGEGYGIAASSLVGQSLGAKRPDMSIVYGKACQRLSFITSTLVFLLFTFAGRYMILMFTSDAEIIAICIPIIFIMCVIIFGQSSQMIFMGSLRGAGDTMYTAIVCMICISVLRPIISYTLAYPVGLGLVGAWLGFLSDQYLRLIFTMKRFSSGKWMHIKL